MTTKLSPIQEAYLKYFELLGQSDAAKADEATAAGDTAKAKAAANTAKDNAIASAQKVFDKKKDTAEDVHRSMVAGIDADMEKVRNATRDAEKAVKDFQDKTKEELGYAPSLPQGAAASNVRRTAL